MTDKTEDYSFDFKAEAKALIKELRAKANNLLFALVDISKPEGEGTRPVVSVPVAVGGKKVKVKHAQEICKQRAEHYTKNPRQSSAYRSNSGLSGLEFSTIRGTISLRESEPLSNIFGNDNKPLMKLFLLFHETAHALIESGPRIDINHPFQESAADAYAALRLLQRFGQDAMPLLSMISWSRSFNALVKGDTSHLTTTVLDKILLDSKRRNFAKLSPAKTIALAATYAEQWTPKAHTLKAARGVFEQVREGNPSLTELLSRSCLSSDHLAMYVGAKAFQGCIHSQNFAAYETTQKLAAEIETRLSKKRLREFFNDPAKQKKIASLRKTPLVTEALMVSLPRHQKQFIYTPY